MKRVLITGAAGFIGSTLLDHLSDIPDVEIVAVDSFADYYPRHIKDENVRLARSRGMDIREVNLATDDISSLLDGVDTVFHQAGQPGVRPSWGSSFNGYVTANITATQRLLEEARASRTLSRFIYASSSSVYGEAETYPTSEKVRPQPVSPYGVTKLAGEHLTYLYGKEFGLPTVALRYFTVYGPRQRPDMAFTRFLYQAYRGRDIMIYGDGQQEREFTYVDDIVRANILAAKVGSVEPGTILNVSGGESHSIATALRVISDVTAEAPRVMFSGRARGDVTRTGGDSKCAQEVLGWAPNVSLHDGLASQAAWMKSNLALYDGIID